MWHWTKMGLWSITVGNHQFTLLVHISVGEIWYFIKERNENDEKQEQKKNVKKSMHKH